jgi:uncharacterized membrane protein YeaQ/YmgE (transglycosylase-associated protein family)
MEILLRSGTPTVLAGIYAGLVALSIVPIFVGGGSLSGILLVLLGSPWAQLLSRALDAIDSGWSSGVAAGLALGVLGGAINAAIIYFLSRWIVRRVMQA